MSARAVGGEAVTVGESARTMDEILAAAVREAVRAEIAPLRAELEQLRGELAGGGGLTTDQAAAAAGVEPKTIREWISSGRLAATKRGRQHRIARADLDRATRGDTQDPREAAAESLRALRRSTG